MITFNNSNPYLHRYTMCNTTCKGKIAIKIIKSADLSRYPACNTICNGKKMSFNNNICYFTITYSLACM